MENNRLCKVEFVEYDDKYLECSWRWLNDVEIKKMTMSPDMTQEAQRKWYSYLKERTDYFVWGMQIESTPIGVVGIKKIDYQAKKGEYFGYIGEKVFWGKGIGTKMIEFIETKAQKIGLNELELHVSVNNLRAIRLYEKNGFIKKEKIDEELYRYIKAI